VATQPPWEWVETLRKTDPDSLVDALEARYLQAELGRQQDTAYGRARALLREREGQLHREAVLADHLLGRLVPKPGRTSTPAQQEVVIQGAPGASASGRFLLANESSEAARFTFGPRRWFDHGGLSIPARPVMLDPDGVVLGAGATCRCRATVELPDQPAEVAISLLADGREVLQLWLCLRPTDHG